MSELWQMYKQACRKYRKPACVYLYLHQSRLQGVKHNWVITVYKYERSRLIRCAVWWGRDSWLVPMWMGQCKALPSSSIMFTRGDARCDAMRWANARLMIYQHSECSTFNIVMWPTEQIPMAYSLDIRRCYSVCIRALGLMHLSLAAVALAPPCIFFMLNCIFQAFFVTCSRFEDIILQLF